jgi:hypothetical protein
MNELTIMFPKHGEIATANLRECMLPGIEQIKAE